MAFRAGITAATNYAASQEAVSQNSWDPNKLIQESMKARSAEKRAAMNAESKVRQTKNNIKADKAIIKARMDIEDSQMDLKKGLRKAGLVAAAGSLAASGFMKKPEMKAPDYTLMEEYIKNYNAKTGESRTKLEELIAEGPKQIDPSDYTIPGSTGNPETAESPTSLQPVSSTLTGNAKMLADSVARFESGSYGYDAFNQGGKKGGAQVVGKSGRFAQSGIGDGRPLTQMTVGEVIKQQSGYDDLSISDAEWRSRGGIHAVGRYQFIGPTLKDQVARSGISMDALFDESTQDKLFLDHLKYVGRIDPTWVGPAKNMDRSELSRLNALVPTL